MKCRTTCTKGRAWVAIDEMQNDLANERMCRNAYIFFGGGKVSICEIFTMSSCQLGVHVLGGMDTTVLREKSSSYQVQQCLLGAGDITERGR